MVIACPSVPEPMSSQVVALMLLLMNRTLPSPRQTFTPPVCLLREKNVAVTGEKTFHETPHPSEFGSVDMFQVLRSLRDTGFNGPMRPDHGRMIWGETGRPGYGLYDRALGAMYLSGLWEGLTRVR